MSNRTNPTGDRRGSRLQYFAWPIGIVVGLTITIAVNLTFIYIAFSGADEVVESYETERR